MSRRQQSQYVEAQAPPGGDFEEDEAVSGTGEGDEVMEDAQGVDEDGYSESCSCYYYYSCHCYD